MNHDFFSTIDTEEKAYWLGFMFADGCVPSNGNQVSLSQKDPSHLGSFLAAVGSKNNVWKDGSTYKVGVRSSKMCSDLISNGCTPAKSKTLGPPSACLGKLTRDFIRGYNDGDGGFYMNPGYGRMRMRGTAPFLTWIGSQLPAGSLVYPQGPTAQLFVVKKRALLETINYLYGGATVYMDRKYDVAMKISSRAGTETT